MVIENINLNTLFFNRTETSFDEIYEQKIDPTDKNVLEVENTQQFGKELDKLCALQAIEPTADVKKCSSKRFLMGTFFIILILEAKTPKVNSWQLNL